MKLLITGGHVTPALAVIDRINEKYKDWNIVFVGRKYTSENEKNTSYEYNEITKKNIRFINLKTGRYTRILSLRSFFSIVAMPMGFMKSWKILVQEKPDAVLSFGGYVALPVALSSFLLHIPVYTHEQTVNPGLANKIIGNFAKKIFVSFQQAQAHFKKNKTIVSGNPLRKAIFKIDEVSLIPENDLPFLYITGGSLGSHSLNNHVLRVLPQLLKKYIVIHQAGDVSEFKDFEKLQALAQTLSKEYQNRYILYKHIYDSYIGYIYSKADLVISRAGANTFFELLKLKKPMIFVPLPWSANGEQLEHARIAKKAGLGEIFNQDDTSDKLLKLVSHMIENLQTYKKNFNKFAKMKDHHAEDIIIDTILADSKI